MPILAVSGNENDAPSNSPIPPALGDQQDFREVTPDDETDEGMNKKLVTI